MCVPLTQAVKYVTAYEAGDTEYKSPASPLSFCSNSRSNISGISTDLYNNAFVRQFFVDIPEEPSAWQILLLLVSVIYISF